MLASTESLDVVSCGTHSANQDALEHVFFAQAAAPAPVLAPRKPAKDLPEARV